MFENYYAVIMAGGGGTRLWPLSRQSRPKQMLSLFDERSMFQTAVDRITSIFPPERIFVVTVQDQARELQAQCTDIPAKNYLIEPAARGTASVIGLAAIAIQQINPQAVMAVLGSDHFIKDEPGFRELLAAAGLAAEDGYLVTLGIEPTFPATGFGYIQKGGLLCSYQDHSVFQVSRFKEKPSQAEAVEMIADGQHLWNSGMFFWRCDLIMEEYKRQMPELYASLQEISLSWGASQAAPVLERVWSALRNETIDYGVMEGARNVVVLPAAGLGWSDVGSWDSLFDLLEGDQNGNIVMSGEHIGVETARSLIYANKAHRLVVTIGIEDLVVVDTEDVLLICAKDQAQRVRQVVHYLKENGKDYI
jgi:mannose-1-phosphate guanylyltransferase